MTIMRRVFNLYQQALNRSPYLVQAVQAGVLMGTGDLIAQKLIERRTLDIKRTLQFSSIGLFIGGPALRTWYGVLNKYIGSHGKSVAIKKVLIDQSIFAPTFSCVLLVTVGVLRGKDWVTIKADLNHNYLDILKANYYIWPWVQLVNFYYIPLQYQVLVVQTVALMWNTYLAWKINKEICVETAVKQGS